MNNKILNLDNIVLNLKSEDKEKVIERAGQLLADRGYVSPDYINGMKAREEVVSTYLGNNVAIPHAINEYKKNIKETGIVILQYPDGVDYGDGNTAYIVIGIAGSDDEHMEILSKIAIVISEEENVQRLRNAASKEEIIKILEEGDF
ncbi:PTS sugar transporter subunit IIA [Clostridium isatidis]|uniref:Mannitol-specific phosphotransferase enzyme IIA component n=1 Tax=Clostridium isatidis TaxID=182773 RepID=A0A343JA13_9CLOT|nr:PTS sugar transporter subunit IIA [Clostridium isatidis]ASW42371.1 PTS mannitol transporter subunit IIA [Clostridium isatidis]